MVIKQILYINYIVMFLLQELYLVLMVSYCNYILHLTILFHIIILEFLWNYNAFVMLIFLFYNYIVFCCNYNKDNLIIIIK